MLVKAQKHVHVYSICMKQDKCAIQLALSLAFMVTTHYSTQKLTHNLFKLP